MELIDPNMRIIAGGLRGRKLQGPGVGDQSIRPTADRAREALFSILQKWPTGGFLDLFAGTGAVGIEAWSRGYSPVTCVERDTRAMILLALNAKGTKITLLPGEIRGLSEGSFQDLMVIFADPPYEQAPELWMELAPRMRKWLRPEGVLIWETDRRVELMKAQGWDLINSRQYGTTRFHFLQVT